MAETIGSQGGDLGQRFVRNQLGRQFGRDRDRHLHRLGLDARLDTCQRLLEPLEIVCDQGKGGCDVLGGLVLRLCVTG